MSRGRPHGLCHEDAYSPIHSHIAVLVAYVTRTSSWPLHEDAYNRQTRVLEAGAEAPAVVVEEEAVVEEAVAYTGVDGEERPSQPAGFHLHLQEYQPQVGTRLVYVGFSHSSIVGVGWVWYP